MRLRYPITPELVTLAFATSQILRRALKDECGLSVLQCRALALLQQKGRVDEREMANAFHAGTSHLSQNLGKLASRDYVYWEAAGRSAKSWSCTAKGRRALDDADVTVAEVYDRLFSGLDPDLHARVRTGLRLTSQSQGFIRVKDGAFFDELAYFESVLASEQAITKSAQEFGLNAAQFRIMYQLLETGPQTKADLSRALALARSTVTWACDTLVERGRVRESRPGKRGTSIHLTERGRELAEKAVIAADRRLCEMRVWSREERQYNQQVAEYFAR